MTIRFLHTSDWHVGKVFGFADNATAGLLQQARISVIERIGELARAHGVHHVLVAGDVYDMEGLAPRSLNQPMERMRACSAVQWHLMPGNHLPNRAGGIWERLRAQGVPPNVHVSLDRKPEIFAEEGFALLPAPLLHGRALEDPTGYMDTAETPDALTRIGLAHGSVTDFGFGREQTPNLIAPGRAARAGLAYLALGDWHGQKKINERCWYSGTPEADDFKVRDGGSVLLVEVDGRAPPTVTPLPSGEYTWLNLHERVGDRASIDALAEKLRALPGRLDRTLVRLSVEGTVSLEERAYLGASILDGVGAAFCFLDFDDHVLFARATATDLDRIDRGGFVRVAAETLQRQAEGGSEHERLVAGRALQRLYLEHMMLEEKRR